jgi:hypothetical protein
MLVWNYVFKIGIYGFHFFKWKPSNIDIYMPTYPSTYHDKEKPTWGITLGLFRDYQRAYLGYKVSGVT